MRRENFCEKKECYIINSNIKKYVTNFSYSNKTDMKLIK